MSGAVLTALAMSLIQPHAATAAELTVSTGTTQLPNSSYKLLSFDTQFAFGEPRSTMFMIQAGTTPPFRAHGFSEFVPYLSVNALWFSKPSGVRYFLATGLGAYSDVVNGDLSPLFSVVLNGGGRIGSESFGMQLSLSTYVGITSLRSFLGSSSVAWPLYSFLGGIYVAL